MNMEDIEPTTVGVEAPVEIVQDAARYKGVEARGNVSKNRRT